MRAFANHAKTAGILQGGLAAALFFLAVLPLHGQERAKFDPRMREAAKEFWVVWKSKYLRSAGEDQLYVDCEINSGIFKTKAQSISEGHGYGMLASVLMAEVDPQSQRTFDALRKFRAAHPSDADPHLMAWRQKFKGGKWAQKGDEDTATDGDLDIAYALVLAERRWGGEGKYLKEAIQMAEAILRCEYNADLKTLTLGSWCTPEEPQWWGWRSSDFMPGHFKALADVTGDMRWKLVTDKGYELLQKVVAKHSPTAGLVPDFLDARDCSPVAPRFLEDKTDGCFYYNACRVPWRLAVDYLSSGDKRALELLQRFSEWARRTTGGDPARFNAGYALNGRPLKEDWGAAFVGPLAVAAFVQPQAHEWSHALGRALLERSAEDEDYYGNTLKLMCLIVLGGFWR